MSEHAMNTYQKCEAIRRIIMIRAGEVMLYENWDSEFCKERMTDIPEFVAGVGDLTGIDPSELTSDECDNLGFCTWSDENPMRLIPLWLHPFLADEIQTCCISGKSVMRRRDMDTDHRGGCLAYGITPKDCIAIADQTP